MNWFDLSIMHIVNSFANRSWFADATMVQLSANNFLEGGVLMVMFWWAWIVQGEESPKKREELASILIISAFAVLIARLFAAVLPYRERPIRDPLLHFQLPYTMDARALIHWSSFPSDHAVVVFCVAAGFWLISRRLGAMAIGYAALISFPRIYVGAHYPTDVLAGALLGTGSAFLSKLPSVRNTASSALNYLDRRPKYLYCLLFVWTFEIGEMFDSVRHIGVLGVKIALKYPRRFEELAASLVVGGLLCVLAWHMWRKDHSAPDHAWPTVRHR